MKLSRKYLASLERYLEWEGCTVPLGDHAARYVRRGFEWNDQGFTAAEAMFSYETHGEVVTILECEGTLAASYLRGKANRDWWTKEIGDWGGLVSCREEYAQHLMPLTFIEVFGVDMFAPRMRLIFDNNYTDKDFNLDMEFAHRGFERVANGVIYTARDLDIWDSYKK
jgi:hypothetical protein